jgi:hypothetical protein
LEISSRGGAPETVAMKAIREVGVGRVVRYLWISGLLAVWRVAWISPLRVLLLGPSFTG